MMQLGPHRTERDHSEATRQQQKHGSTLQLVLPHGKGDQGSLELIRKLTENTKKGQIHGQDLFYVI